MQKLLEVRSRTTALTCASLVLLVSSVVLSQLRSIGADDSSDGPKRIFKDDFIENLTGDWKLTRKIRGKEVQNTVKVEWVLNHQFLRIHMKDVALPPTHEALVLIGCSYADKKYIAHWCDTYGGKFSAMGSGKRSGDSIEFEFQYPDGPFYNTFTWDAKAKGWTFAWNPRTKTANASYSPRIHSGVARFQVPVPPLCLFASLLEPKHSGLNPRSKIHPPPPKLYLPSRTFS